MKKFLFALSMLAFVVSALPQARGEDVSIDFIYDNLSGGNWIEAEGYGYGWQPDVAVSDPNWRPYADGYWAYTDYGWTWISYEDFGWATYHYGRWANLADYGWVWFPGSDLDWGPAWVSWRTGGDYIGWAPLPPRGPGVVYEGQPIGARVDIEYDIGPQYYNFCDVRFIGEPVLRDRIFPPTQNITYINNTVNVTNITVQNNVVYNYGPDYNVLSSYSTRPIQRLTVERETAANLAVAAKSGALTKVQGNKLVVAAPPRIAKASPTMKPHAVKATVAQPRFEHGWTGVQNRAELEQKIKTENPRNIPPRTRAATRAGGSPLPAAESSPAEGGSKPPLSPNARGRAGRVLPGATATTAGGSPAPFERGKPTPGGRPRPGVTAAPAIRSPAPIERGERPGRPGATAPPSFRQSPPPERGRPPTQNFGESPAPGSTGGAEQAAPQRQKFGTPPPMSAGEGQRRGGEPRTLPPTGAGTSARPGGEQRTPPGLRHPVSPPPMGGPAGGAHGARQPGPGFNQPGRPARTAVPATAEHGQGQPEHEKKKPEKGTPPPKPQ
jgi:hypothetical protein